jgi:predicted P-loop ATPase
MPSARETNTPEVRVASMTETPPDLSGERETSEDATVVQTANEPRAQDAHGVSPDTDASARELRPTAAHASGEPTTPETMHHAPNVEPESKAEPLRTRREEPKRSRPRPERPAHVGEAVAAPTEARSPASRIAARDNAPEPHASERRARVALQGSAEHLGRIVDVKRLPHAWMRELLWIRRTEGKGDKKAVWFVPKSCTANAITILTHDDRWGGVLARNDFGEADIIRRMPPWHEHEAEGASVGPWTDPDTTRLGAWFDRAYGITLKDSAFERVVSVAAEARRFHPVREYLRWLKWDGKRRLHTMLSTYFGAKGSPYASAVGPRYMIGAVARVMRPGCQMDCTLVFEGPQGIGKNRGVRALVPDPDWYSETRIEIGTKDSFQNLRGKWIYLLDELDSLKRADLSRVKGFLTSPRDTYRESYGRRARDFQRQTVFCGTTNEDEWLTDPTGNRRFWPVHVHRPPDIEAIARDRDQLWAEALDLFDKGTPWHVDTPELRALCEAEQGDRVQQDIWLPLIAAWLADPYEIAWETDEDGKRRCQRWPYDASQGVLAVDIAMHALEKPRGQVTSGDYQRIGRCLLAMKYEHQPQSREHGAQVRRWKPSPTVTDRHRPAPGTQ